MSGRRVLLYFSWSRPAETRAPLFDISNRFPALFEMRRSHFPAYEQFSDASRVDQGIAGFLDHIQKPNFSDFVAQTRRLTGNPPIVVERVADDGAVTPLDSALLDGIDSLIIISFDSLLTQQIASVSEIEAMRSFLRNPDNLAAVCPHHDIGEVANINGKLERQIAEYLHHGDKGIPPVQGFGSFARSLLAGLGVPVENRYGLRPAVLSDGSPAPVEIANALDRLQLFNGMTTLNAHPHLPQLERLGASEEKLDVIIRQRIDLSVPPHPFTQKGRRCLDAVLQSRRDVFNGTLLVGDATLWSSTAGGAENLRRLWENIVLRTQCG